MISDMARSMCTAKVGGGGSSDGKGEVEMGTGDTAPATQVTIIFAFVEKL